MGRRHLYDKEIREEAVARVMNGETLADSEAMAYDAAVETLRKAVFKQEGEDE